jgi:hypothetical protein
MKEIWFGHPEELAKLAAAVSHGKKPAKAVAYALELCRESVRALDRIARDEGGVPGLGFNPFSTDATLERLEKLESWKKAVPKPETLPATLDDFFDKIVKAKTPADNYKRLRDFFCQVTFASDNDPQSKAVEVIQRIKDRDKQTGFFTQTIWEIMGGRYLEWWKNQKSSKARESAKKRKKLLAPT